MSDLKKLTYYYNILITIIYFTRKILIFFGFYITIQYNYNEGTILKC